MSEPDPRYGFTPPEDLQHFRMKLSRYEVDRILHYTHPIPNMKGFTAKFFAENYPNGSLHKFMNVFREANILLPGGSVGGRCHWKLKFIYFSSRTIFYVQWDPEVLEDDNLFYGGYQFLIPGKEFLKSIESETPEE